MVFCENEEIHVADVGTIVRPRIVDCQTGDPVDISTATTLQITFTKPDKTIMVRTAVFTTDGTDGKMQYVIQSGDLDQMGFWEYQGKVILPSGTWHASIEEFKVLANLQD